MKDFASRRFDAEVLNEEEIRAALNDVLRAEGLTQDSLTRADIERFERRIRIGHAAVLRVRREQ